MLNPIYVSLTLEFIFIIAALKWRSRALVGSPENLSFHDFVLAWYKLILLSKVNIMMFPSNAQNLGLCRISFSPPDILCLVYSVYMSPQNMGLPWVDHIAHYRQVVCACLVERAVTSQLDGFCSSWMNYARGLSFLPKAVLWP